MEGSVYGLDSPPRPLRKLNSEQKLLMQEVLNITIKEISEKNSAKAEECSVNIHDAPCSIYRVPSQIRKKKPEAYTPQIVVIGPLHRLKPTTIDNAETSTNPWIIKEEYSNMEVIKKRYLESFTERVGEDTIKLMRKIIHANENKIRSSYSETTDWIKSEDFMELVLHDSVFIGEIIIREYEQEELSIVMSQDQFPFDIEMVKSDLILLENQIPFFILNIFLSPIMEGLFLGPFSFERFIFRFFCISFRFSITFWATFKHFTDMFRCLYEYSIAGDIREQMKLKPIAWPPIKEMRNAEKLSHAGLDFMSLNALHFSKMDSLALLLSGTFSDAGEMEIERRVKERERTVGFSLNVEFEKGTIWMPEIFANKESDVQLRNVIAYEQRNVAVIPFTSNYIHFLNFLITSTRDVQLLIEEGVVKNAMGRPSLVVDMVSELKDGVKQGNTSQYHNIVKDLKIHCKSRRKRNWATLKKVYFSDLWTGTATTAAVLLLLMTFVSTVASVVQAYKSF